MAHNLCYTTLLRPGAAQKLGYGPTFSTCLPRWPGPCLRGQSVGETGTGPEIVVREREPRELGGLESRRRSQPEEARRLHQPDRRPVHQDAHRGRVCEDVCAQGAAAPDPGEPAQCPEEVCPQPRPPAQSSALQRGSAALLPTASAPGPGRPVTTPWLCVHHLQLGAFAREPSSSAVHGTLQEGHPEQCVGLGPSLGLWSPPETWGTT